MTPEQKAAFDVLSIVACALVVFCCGAWFGWEACKAKHRSEHVSRRG